MEEYPTPSRSSRYSYSSSKRSPESIADLSESDDRKMKLKRRSLTRADYSYDSHRSSRSTDHSTERGGDVIYWEQGGEVKREKKPKRDPKEKEERRERRRRERSGTLDGGDGVRIPAEVVEHRRPTEEHRRVNSQPIEEHRRVGSQPVEEHRRINSQPIEVEQRRSGTQSTEVSPTDTSSTPKPAPAPTSKQSVMKEVVKVVGMAHQLPSLPEAVPMVAAPPPPPPRKAAIILPPPPPKLPVVVATQQPTPPKADAPSPRAAPSPKAAAPPQKAAAPPLKAAAPPPAPQPTPAVPVPAVKKPQTPPVVKSPIQAPAPAPAPARPATPPGSVAKPASPTNRPPTPPHSTPSSPARKKSPATVHFTPSTVTPSSPPSTFRAPPPPRTRTKRPHSFSTNALVSYTVPDEDQTTPRGKPPRRASNPYPSYGYDGYPPPQPFPYQQMYPEQHQVHPEQQQMYPEQQQMYPEQQQMYPEPQQIYPEPQGYPEYSYNQAQDPFQYMEKPERAERPERTERRRSRRRSKEDEEEATRKVRGEPTVEIEEISDSVWTDSRDPSMTRSPITTIPEHLPEAPELDTQHYEAGLEQHTKQQYPDKPDSFPAEPSFVDMSATLPPSPTAPLAPPQIYPRFTSLNTLILQHMVAEIEGLSAALTQLDNTTPTPHTQQQRLELLNTLAWKLEKYNLAATSYHATCALPSAPAEEVAAYTQHLPLPPSVDEKEFFTLTPAPPALPAAPAPSVCTLPHHPPCPPRDSSPEQKDAPRRWYSPPTPALAPTALHLLTIAAILLAPWVVEFVKHSRVQVGEEKVWGWEMYALRGTMWVLALAAAAVEVVKGKGWFAFCVLVVGLGCVLGLLAGS